MNIIIDRIDCNKLYETIEARLAARFKGRWKYCTGPHGIDWYHYIITVIVELGEYTLTPEVPWYLTRYWRPLSIVWSPCTTTLYQYCLLKEVLSLIVHSMLNVVSIRRDISKQWRVFSHFPVMILLDTKSIYCNSYSLIYWGRIKKTFVSKSFEILGADNGLAPSQCWLIVNWAHSIKLQWTFIKVNLIFDENAFSNDVCKMAPFCLDLNV